MVEEKLDSYEYTVHNRGSGFNFVLYANFFGNDIGSGKFIADFKVLQQEGKSLKFKHQEILYEKSLELVKKWL